MDRYEKEFLQLVNEHQPIIHKISFLYSTSLANRKDLEQEIVLQLWKSYGSFKGQSAFSTWMYRVALNTAISMTKRPNLFVLSEKVPTIPDDTEFNMELSEDVKILYKAIYQLKKVEKAIILMWLDEKSYDEIAETMGISVKNVSVKRVRIKSELAEKIKKLQ